MIITVACHLISAGGEFDFPLIGLPAHDRELGQLSFLQHNTGEGSVHNQGSENFANVYWQLYFPCVVCVYTFDSLMHSKERCSYYLVVTIEDKT